MCTLCFYMCVCVCIRGRCVYVFVYMYVCLYVWVCMSVCVCLYMCVCIYVYGELKHSCLPHGTAGVQVS